MIRFVANLRHEILRPLRLKHYESLEAAFHDASRIEDLKEEKAYKTKRTSTSSWSKNEDKWKSSSTQEHSKSGGPITQPKIDPKTKEESIPKGTYYKLSRPRPFYYPMFKVSREGTCC